MPKCDECSAIYIIDGFGGYEHYAAARKMAENYVRENLWEQTDSNSFEIFYRCTRCGTVWKLGIPDFPVMGYFMEEKE